MTNQLPLQPNDFQLQGHSTKLSYSTTSITGEPRLSYQTLKLSRNFSGREISTLETTIGNLVTVVLEPNVDQGRSVFFTLLVPTINLPADILENPIETEAILTIQREIPFNPDSPPFVEGQVQTYKTLSFKGTARLVEF